MGSPPQPRPVRIGAGGGLPALRGEQGTGRIRPPDPPPTGGAVLAGVPQPLCTSAGTAQGSRGAQEIPRGSQGVPGSF